MQRRKYYGEVIDSKKAGKLLRRFRNDKGISLSVMSGLTGLSKAMISQFERGFFNLSVELWGRVLEEVSKLYDAPPNPNLRLSDKKSLIADARAKDTAQKLFRLGKTAAELGKLAAQTVKSPTLTEKALEFSRMPEPATLDDAIMRIQDMNELMQRLANDNGTLRYKEQFWYKILAESDASKLKQQIADLQRLCGIRTEVIAKEAEADALQEQIEERAKHEGTE